MSNASNRPPELGLNNSPLNAVIQENKMLKQETKELQNQVTTLQDAQRANRFLSKSLKKAVLAQTELAKNLELIRGTLEDNDLAKSSAIKVSIIASIANLEVIIDSDKETFQHYINTFGKMSCDDSLIDNANSGKQDIEKKTPLEKKVHLPNATYPSLKSMFEQLKEFIVKMVENGLTGRAIFDVLLATSNIKEKALCIVPDYGPKKGQAVKYELTRDKVPSSLTKLISEIRKEIKLAEKQ